MHNRNRINKNYFHLIMKQRYYIVYILLWIIMAYWFYRVVSESKPAAHAEETFAVNNFSTFEIGKPYYIIEAYETLLALTYDKDVGEVTLAPYPEDNELQQWIPVREGISDLRSATHKYCATAVLQPGVQYGTSFLLKNKAHPVYLNVYYDTSRRMIGYNVFELYTITTNNRVVDNLDSPIFTTEPVEDRARCAQLRASQLLRPKCTLTDNDVRDNWVIDTPAVAKKCLSQVVKAPYPKKDFRYENEWHYLDCDGGDIQDGTWWYGAPLVRDIEGNCGWDGADRGSCSWSPSWIFNPDIDDPNDYNWFWSQHIWNTPWPTGWRNACNGAKNCRWPVTNNEWHNDPRYGWPKKSFVQYTCKNTPSGECTKWSAEIPAKLKNDKIYTPYCKKCKLFTGNYNKVTCTDTTNNIRDAQKFKFVNNELQLVDKLTTTGNTALNSAEKQYVSLTPEDKLTLTGGESSIFYFIPPASRAVLYAQYIIKNQKMPANIPLEQRINEDVRGSLQTS